MYTQLRFILDRVTTLVPQHPEWSTKPLFRGLLIGDAEAMAHAAEGDYDELDKATTVDMPVDSFHSLVTSWMATATHPRYHRPYTDLVFQPMLEVMNYLRNNGYRVYTVTGGGQEFVRTYGERVYGIPAGPGDRVRSGDRVRV